MLYTIFDTETSGLEGDCDILSFSYMLSDEKLGVRRAEVLYFWKEGLTKWSQEAYEINGLSKEFLRKHEKDYEKNCRKMYIFLQNAMLVGYNSGWVSSDGIIRGFDFQRCSAFLRRNGFPEVSPFGFIDVMKMGHDKYGRNMKLQTVFDSEGLDRSMADVYNAAFFGETGGAHTSSYDVVCTAMLFNKWYVSQENAIVHVEDELPVEWYIKFREGGMFDVISVSDDKKTVYTIEEMSAYNRDTLMYLMENPYAHLYPEEDV